MAVIIVCLFLAAVLWVGLQSVVVVVAFPGRTHVILLMRGVGCFALNELLLR